MSKMKKKKFNFGVFLQECIKRGPMTFQDHAVASGLTEDWAVYSRARSLVNQAIKPGGTHPLLAGKIFLPDAAALRQPLWADGHQQAASKTLTPAFTGAPALVAIQTEVGKLNSLTPATQQAANTLILSLAKASKKKQMIAQEFVRQMTVEVARRDAKIESQLEQIVALKDEQIAELKLQLARVPATPVGA